MTNQELTEMLENLENDHLIHPRGGSLVVQTIVSKKYPEVDIDFLCTLLEDYLFDWHDVIREYVERYGEEA